MTVSNNDESNALDLKYRPRNLDEVIGHETAVQMLKGIVASGKIPNALLFLGPTSAGKTTLAQAFAASASGLPTIAQQSDFSAYNAGDQRSIDDVRNWARLARMNPMTLPRRWMLIDEAQGLLSNAAAATALLVPIENPSARTTWLLTSMEPEKFASSANGKAILGRCTKIKLTGHTTRDLCLQAARILKGENLRADFSKDAIIKIAENSQGQMRELAKLLHSVISWNAGRGGGSVSPEDVAKVLVTVDANDDEVDSIAWQWLYAVYLRNATVAARYLLHVTDVFSFLMRAQLINRVVILDAANKHAQHSKIWHNSATRSLVAKIKESDKVPKIAERGVAIHNGITSARVAGAFDLDALIALTHRITTD